MKPKSLTTSLTTLMLPTALTLSKGVLLSNLKASLRGERRSCDASRGHMRRQVLTNLSHEPNLRPMKREIIRNPAKGESL